MNLQHWSEVDKKEMAQALEGTVSELKDDHSKRVDKYRRMATLYKDAPVSGFDKDTWCSVDYAGRPATYNVLRASIDTIVAKITLHTPAPRASTFGGDEEMQDRARAMEKLVLGVIQQEQANQTARECFRDAGIYGISVAKVFEESGKIRVRRVHPSRILVDEAAAIDGRPSSFYQVETISKRWLLAQFPDAKNVINRATGATKLKNGRLVGDDVEVIEAWTLPCGKLKGRHVISVGATGLILDEPWHEENPPFVFGYWDEDILGFYGIGLAEQLEGVQLEINSIFEAVSINREETRPYWIKEKSAKIIDSQAFTTENNRIVEYLGTPPQRVTPDIISSQELQLLNMLVQWGFEIAGVSQLSATSRQPANFESGAAIRQFLDVETVRHSVAAKLHEQWYVDLFGRSVDCARRTAKRNKSWAVNYLGKDGLMERIEWGKASLEQDQFHMYVQPTSSLPAHPSARLERAMEMRREQLIDLDEFRALVDMPDLEKYNRLRTAPYEQFERIFERMLKTGEYIPPLPYGQNLSLGVSIGAAYYSRAWIDEKPQERIDLLTQWIMEAGDILTRQQPPMMEEPAPEHQPMAQPGGGGDG